MVLRDGEIQKELKPAETNEREIAEYMVGRFSEKTGKIERYANLLRLYLK